MFSARIVSTDHYQAAPVRGLDVCYSDFRACETRRVPVTRVYGATPAGQKTCVHIHGVFPYLYVLYDGTQPMERYLRQFASSVDKALNVALGKASSDVQHVFKITLVSGITFYGYHDEEQMFLKIYLYNPVMIRKLADLLLAGGIMNKSFQPYESHIPYLLQLFIDYNLYGMNMLNMAAVKFRRPRDKDGTKAGRKHASGDSLSPELCTLDNSSILGSSCSPPDKHWDVENIPRDLWLGEEVERHSSCELEVDVVAADILNRLEVGDNVGSNPGLNALWEEERQRRRQRGLDDKITPPGSPEREDIAWTDAEAAMQDKLRDIMQQLEPYLKVPASPESQPLSLADDLSSQMFPATAASARAAANAPPTVAENEAMSPDSQDTVQLEEEEEEDATPIINEMSILRTVSSSQSFSAERQDAEVAAQILGASQDRALAEMLASLAEDESPAASQLASQLTALEEQDSILSQASTESKEQLGEATKEDRDEEDEETLEMSQQVWNGDGEETQDAGQQQSQPSADFNLEGMDQSWNSSQWVTVGAHSEPTETVPQFDGPADEKNDGQSLTRRKRLGVQERARSKAVAKGKINGLKGSPADPASPAGVAGSVRASPRKAALKFSAIDMLRAGGQLVGTSRRKELERPVESMKSSKKAFPKTKVPKVTLQPESRKKERLEAKEFMRQADSEEKTASDSGQDDARKFKFGKLKKYEESLEKKRLSVSDNLEGAEECAEASKLMKQVATQGKRHWSLRRRARVTEESGNSKTEKAMTRPSRLKLKRRQLREEHREQDRMTRRTTSNGEEAESKTPKQQGAKKLKKLTTKARTKHEARDSTSSERDRVHDNIFSSLGSLSDDSWPQKSSSSADPVMPVLEKLNNPAIPTPDNADGRDDFVSDEEAGSQNFCIIRGRRGSSDSSCSDVSLTMMVGPHGKTYGPDASPRHGWTSTSGNKSKHFDQLLGRPPASSSSSRRTSLGSEEEESTFSARILQKPDPETEEEELEQFELEVENECEARAASLNAQHLGKLAPITNISSEHGSNNDLMPEETGLLSSFVSVPSPPSEIGETTAKDPDEPKTLPPSADETEGGIDSTEENVAQEHVRVEHSTEHLAENEGFVLEVPVTPESQSDVDMAMVQSHKDADVLAEDEQDKKKAGADKTEHQADGEAQGESSQKQSESESDSPPEEQTEETTGFRCRKEAWPAAEGPLVVPMSDVEKDTTENLEGAVELHDEAEDDEKVAAGQEENDGAVAAHREEQSEKTGKESMPNDKAEIEEVEQPAKSDGTARFEELGTEVEELEQHERTDNTALLEEPETQVEEFQESEGRENPAKLEGPGMEATELEQYEKTDDTAGLEEPGTEKRKSEHVPSEEAKVLKEAENEEVEDMTESEAVAKQAQEQGFVQAMKGRKLLEAASSTKEQETRDELEARRSKQAGKQVEEQKAAKEREDANEPVEESNSEKVPGQQTESKKEQSTHPLASTIIIVRPSSPRMPVLSRVKEPHKFPPPSARTAARASHSPKVLYPVSKPEMGKNTSLSENWPGFETIAMGSRAGPDCDKAHEHSDSDSSASRPFKAVSLADRKKKLSLKRQQLRVNAEQRREAENGTPVDSETRSSEPSRSRRLLNARPRAHNKFAYTLNEFGDIIVKKSKDVAQALEQKYGEELLGDGVKKIVIAKPAGVPFSFKTPVGMPIYMGSKAAVPVPASSKYKVAVAPGLTPVVTKVPASESPKQIAPSTPETQPQKGPRMFLPKKREQTTAFKSVDSPSCSTAQSKLDEPVAPENRLPSSIVKKATCSATYTSLQPGIQKESRESALQKLGDIAKNIDSSQSTIVTINKRPPSPRKSRGSGHFSVSPPKESRALKHEKKSRKKLQQAEMIENPPVPASQRPTGRISFPYRINPSYHNSMNTKTLEPKTRLLASMNSHEEQYVKVLKTDCFDYDLREVGNEKLVLAKCSEKDIEELKQQVKLEEKHRRSEHIMPLVLQMTDSEVEARFSGYYEQRGNFLDKLPEKELKLDSDHDNQSGKSVPSVLSTQHGSSKHNIKRKKRRSLIPEGTDVQGKDCGGPLQDEDAPNEVERPRISEEEDAEKQCAEIFPSLEPVVAEDSADETHDQNTESLLHLEEVTIEELASGPEEVVEIYEDSPMKISKGGEKALAKVRMVGDDEPPILVPMGLPKIKAVPRKISVRETHFRARKDSSRSSSGSSSERTSIETEPSSKVSSSSVPSSNGSPFSLKKVKTWKGDFEKERRKCTGRKDSSGSSVEKEQTPVPPDGPNLVQKPGDGKSAFSVMAEDRQEEEEHVKAEERAHSDSEAVVSWSSVLRDAEGVAGASHKRRNSDGEKKSARKRKVIQQSDHYKYRSKRVAVDYSPAAFSHIYQMEKERSLCMVSSESVTIALSGTEDAEDEEPSTESQTPKSRSLSDRCLYRKFQGYRSMKVLVERLNLEEDDVVIASHFLKRKTNFSIQRESHYSDSGGESEASSPKKLAFDISSENVDDPLWKAQKDRLAELPLPSNGHSSPSTDESSHDCDVLKKSPRKKQPSQSKRLQTAFLKSRKRRRSKNDSPKFLDSLSALHRATVSSLDTTQDGSETYADKAGDDYAAPYNDVMYKMSLLSPVVSSEGEKSPARPLSPCEMNPGNKPPQDGVIDLSSNQDTPHKTDSFHECEELIQDQMDTSPSMPSVSNRDLTSPTLDEGLPPPDLGPPVSGSQSPLSEHSIGNQSPPHLYTADEEECPPLALEQFEEAAVRSEEAGASSDPSGLEKEMPEEAKDEVKPEGSHSVKMPNLADAGKQVGKTDHAQDVDTAEVAVKAPTVMATPERLKSDKHEETATAVQMSSTEFVEEAIPSQHFGMMACAPELELSGSSQNFAHGTIIESDRAMPMSTDSVKEKNCGASFCTREPTEILKSAETAGKTTEERLEDAEVESIQSMSPIHSPSPPQSPEMQTEPEPLHTPATIPLNIEDPTIQAEVEQQRRAKLAKLVGRRLGERRDSKYLLVGKVPDGKWRMHPVESRPALPSLAGTSTSNELDQEAAAGSCSCSQELGSGSLDAKTCMVSAARKDNRAAGRAEDEKPAGGSGCLGSISSSSGSRDQGHGEPLPTPDGGRGRPVNVPTDIAEVSSSRNIILKPVLDPPAKSQVADEVAVQGLATVGQKEAFCGNPADIPEKPRELGGRLLKVQSSLVCDLPQYESALQQDGFRNWQILLAPGLGPDSQPFNTSFNLIGEMERNPQLKAAMIGGDSIVITPCLLPPSPQKVAQWTRGRLQYKQVNAMQEKTLSNNTKAPDKTEPGLEAPSTGPSDRKGKRTAGMPVKKTKRPEVVGQTDISTGTTDGVSKTPEVGKSYSSPPIQKRKSVDFSPIVQVVPPVKKSFSQESLSTAKCQRPSSPVKMLCSTPTKESATPPMDACIPPPCTPIAWRDEDTTPGVGGKVARTSTKRESSKNEESVRRTLVSSQTKNCYHTPSGQKASVSQIDGPTPKNTFGFRVESQNIQDAKSMHQFQYITILSLEIHARSRKDQLPDPEFDPVCALFYSIHNDVPPEEGQREVTGVIAVDLESASQVGANKRKGGGMSAARGADNGMTHHRQLLLQRTGLPSMNVTYVRDENDLLNELVNLVAHWDPDIFVGYEIQMKSWGYLLHRAAHLNIDLATQLARVAESRETRFSMEKDEYGADHSSEIHIAGRVVLNLWRLLRHEVTLNIYGFENVAFHVLHRRLPLYTNHVLSQWWDHRTDLHRWRTIEYYIIRCHGNIEIIEQLDLIGQTSEFARVFGIEFYHVLSRGSQYRVESMMLRIAKPMDYIPVSPSVQQRARMQAPECIPLNMEPESRFYTDPVVVLDFQSLYPSIMIAYNYCYSTCLGRIEHLAKANEGPFEFGCTALNVPPDILKKLESDVNICPNGVVFLRQHIKKGILPRMVESILNTRIMVKKSIKEYKDNKTLKRLLHARQLGLKLIANVTFGYTSANYSGRMPCVEIGDSIVRKARETLERAIQLVEENTSWGGRVVYGDTDSLFIEFKGKSKAEAFKLGQEIADVVTASNPKPVKLKFEKVYLPCVLQTKKRYVGFMYETPDQVEPVYDAKGIETVRRDTCSAVAKVLEKSIKLMFTTRDISRVKQYVQQQCIKLMEGKVSIQDCIFAKEYRGIGGYRPTACVPALEIARKLLAKDKRAEPRTSERVPYVIVYGTPGLPLIQLVRQPGEVVQDPNLRINATYYITKQIVPPLARMFSLMGVDVMAWYNELPRVQRALPPSHFTENKKGTISQYFSTLVCPVCEGSTSHGSCEQCRRDPQRVAVVLAGRVHGWERTYSRLAQVCSNCMGVKDFEHPCVSLDCPIMFRLSTGRRHVQQIPHLQEIQQKLLQF